MAATRKRWATLRRLEGEAPPPPAEPDPDAQPRRKTTVTAGVPDPSPADQARIGERDRAYIERRELHRAIREATP